MRAGGESKAWESLTRRREQCNDHFGSVEVLFYTDANRKFAGFTGVYEMKPGFVARGVGRAHPGFDAIERRILREGPGHERRIGRRDFLRAQAHNHISR